MESSPNTLMDQNAAPAAEAATAPDAADGRRRSTGRLPILVPIVIKGTDADGRSFIEHSHTLLVNKAGLKTLSKQALAPGIRIQIAVPSRQRVSWATIAWLGEKKTEGREVGIALERATDDFWGVEFPAAASTSDRQPGEGTGHPARNGSRGTSSNASSSERPASSDKLSGALRELAQSAIEEALEEALKSFHARADEMQSEAVSQFAAQLQDRVEQALSAAGERFETQATELISRRQQDWERGLELLGESLGDAAGERIRSRAAEQEQLLIASAGKVSHDLGERLSAASRLLAGSQDLPA